MSGFDSFMKKYTNKLWSFIGIDIKNEMLRNLLDGFSLLILVVVVLMLILFIPNLIYKFLF